MTFKDLVIGDYFRALDEAEDCIFQKTGSDDYSECHGRNAKLVRGTWRSKHGGHVVMRENDECFTFADEPVEKVIKANF